MLRRWHALISRWSSWILLRFRFRLLFRFLHLGASLGHLAAIEWLNSSVVAADAERVRSVGSELRALLRAFYDALELRR